MAARLDALCFDALDPAGLARFWSGILGWEISDDVDHRVTLLPSDDTGFRIRFVRTDEPKSGPNQIHFDLTSSSLEEQQVTVDRALALGGRHLDVGQLPEEEHVVLADPEGNEFCVIEPGNAFLADCGFIGALSGDGSQACGYFWAGALDWPLVWDQDEETAIRSPHGGPKLTWGGPPVEPRHGTRYRPHFDLACVDGDLPGEVSRLESLGAARIDRARLDRARTDRARSDLQRVVMVDPDGHEFCVLSA